MVFPISIVFGNNKKLPQQTGVLKENIDSVLLTEF